VQGFDPQSNQGDFGVFSGTDEKSDTMYEAVVDLLGHLHLTPAPVPKSVPRDPETEWNLTKIDPTLAKWEATAPDTLSKEYLSLTLTESSVKISAYNENDSLPDYRRLTAPTFGSLPKATYLHENGRTEIPSVAAGIVLVRELLSKTPSTLVSTADFK
jgi:hypothetical protein